MKTFWTRLKKKVSGTPVVRVRTEHVLEAWHVCNLLARDVTVYVKGESIEFMTKDRKWTTDFAKFVSEYTPSRIEKTVKAEIDHSGANGAGNSEDREVEVVVASIIIATVLPTWAAGALAHGESLARYMKHPNEYCADWFNEQKEKFQNL